MQAVIMAKTVHLLLEQGTGEGKKTATYPLSTTPRPAIPRVLRLGFAGEGDDVLRAYAPWGSTRNWLDACWLPHIACALSTIVLSTRLVLVLDMRRRMGEGRTSASTRGRNSLCVSRVVT